MKRPKANKLSTNFDPSPYEITDIKGSRITAERDGHKIVRNASFFKKITKQSTNDSDDDDYVFPKETISDEQRQPLRKSTRVRTQTQFYGQPVTSNIVS